MTDAPVPTPVLTITWDTAITELAVGGYDPEAGPDVQPVSLGEMVVEAIAAQYTEQLRSDANEWYDRVAEVRRAAHAFAREFGRRQRIVTPRRLVRTNAAYSHSQARASALITWTLA